MVFVHFHARMASATGFKSEGFFTVDFSVDTYENPDRRSYGCKPAVECICSDSGKDLSVYTSKKSIITFRMPMVNFRSKLCLSR